MNQKEYAYFGSADNKRSQRNAEAIWELVKDDPRYCCHGRAISLAEGFEVTLHLPSYSLSEAEKMLIEKVVYQTKWNLKQAAATLGISRGTLYSKLEKHKIKKM